MSKDAHEPVEVTIPIKRLIGIKKVVVNAILAKVYFDNDFEAMKESVGELRLAALKDVDVFLGKYCGKHEVDEIIDECHKVFGKVFPNKPGYDYDELD